ncbi:MAG: M15 family metallopeptidase [Elusimicrobia bacterium]|nr:M15 family metallopeptidase [Elusimicrobiota bacterium]
MNTANICDMKSGLKSAWIKCSAEYEKLYAGRKIILTCAYRSPAEQAALYAIGRTKPGKIITLCDGVKKASKHNCRPSRAFDAAVFLGGKLSWEIYPYADFAAIIKKEGVMWGGDWKKFKDYPHFEV